MHRLPAPDRRDRRVLAFVGACVVIAAVLLISLAATSGGGSGVPAFSPKQLASAPSDDWITNGGSTSNERYSALDQIDASNVAQLKGIWHVHLKSGSAPKYSGEAQPLEYKGVIYTITGADDVFATDAKTGATKWVYRAHLNQTITTVCCGWTSRGVALGDGKVYLGQLDGKLVALDQQSGKVDWSKQVMRWQEGYTITSAPLYYDGRVYTGISGGGRARSVTTPGRRPVARGSTAARPFGRRRRLIPTSACSTSRPGTRHRTPTARSGPAIICSPARSSRSTRRPAATAGISKKSTTTSGTTTRPARSCCST